MSDIAFYGYDEIFGMNLDEYASLQNTTVDGLIRKVELDIYILKKRLEELYVDLKKPCPKGDSVYRVLKKKESHKERLLEWKKISSKSLTRLEVYRDIVKREKALFLNTQREKGLSPSPSDWDKKRREINIFAVKNTNKEFLENQKKRG